MSSKFKKHAGATYQVVHSNFYRVMYADGVNVMGKLPTNLELRFFTDRVSYPHQFTRLVKDGMLADVIPETELKKSEWIREIEASVIITLDLAEKLHLRLGEWIKNQKKVSDENKVVS